MKLIILGAPRTKKNSLRIAKNKRTGKSFPMQSAAHNDWSKSAVSQLRDQFQAAGKFFSRQFDIPVAVRATIYRERATGDLLNYLAAISDALEHAGVVENDRLCVSWDGSRMAKDAVNPRVEIEIEAVT